MCQNKPRRGLYTNFGYRTRTAVKYCRKKELCRKIFNSICFSNSQWDSKQTIQKEALKVKVRWHLIRMEPKQHVPGRVHGVSVFSKPAGKAGWRPR